MDGNCLLVDPTWTYADLLPNPSTCPFYHLYQRCLLCSLICMWLAILLCRKCCCCFFRFSIRLPWRIFFVCSQRITLQVQLEMKHYAPFVRPIQRPSILLFLASTGTWWYTTITYQRILTPFYSFNPSDLYPLLLLFLFHHLNLLSIESYPNSIHFPIGASDSYVGHSAWFEHKPVNNFTGDGSKNLVL